MGSAAPTGRATIRSAARIAIAEMVRLGFTAAEVEMLATPGGRRQAVRWAGAYNRAPQMKDFVKGATRLAFTRQRILSGRDVQVHQQDEVQQLRELVALRAAVGH